MVSAGGTSVVRRERSRQSPARAIGRTWRLSVIAAVTKPEHACRKRPMQPGWVSSAILDFVFMDGDQSLPRELLKEIHEIPARLLLLNTIAIAEHSQ